MLGHYSQACLQSSEINGEQTVSQGTHQHAAFCQPSEMVLMSAPEKTRENQAPAVGAACKGTENDQQEMLQMAELGTLDINTSFQVHGKHRQ